MNAQFQYVINLLKDGIFTKRFVNTVNLSSAQFIAEYLYGGDRYEIVSVEVNHWV